ncbi:Pih1p Ecym_3194 [Eremothecium cymbalariae DBVPG|uniref:PIH1 N-terminal domain-containing protein n=1 Tax=Eremothecium cymbalariae (strain CBS 270.75 / DBVPG 7215 / KCTC 17166 / NRRL Y-17582) TaxID=931890 RepID=G8JRC5_ERECY|nr:Hypothetical protein Ecym_3194 [Eremothecium cymbalariae DBVPG\
MDFLLRPIDSKESSVINIQPQPGFVVKSKLEFSKNNCLKLKTKTLINICHDEQIPCPEVDFNPSIVYPLIMNNKWEIPIVTSSVREDTDKKGKLCYVWDCCVNSKCMQWIRKDYQLREILVEWCLESCELRQEVSISREVLTFPKLKSKGHIPPLEILVQDLEQDFKEGNEETVHVGQSNPASILKLRGYMQEQETLSTSMNGDSLPPLFPNSSTASKYKPLIEEIDLPNVHRTLNRVPKRKEIDYSIIMGKPKDTSVYKIKIEITSPLQLSSEYALHYDPSENALLISHTRTDIYIAKEIKIPLPNIFATTPTIKSFFIMCDARLLIFL